jgi:hypothetical protein
MHEARESVAIDPVGGAPLHCGDGKNNIRALFVHNKTTNANALLLVLGDDPVGGKDRFRMEPGQWKRIPKEETSRLGFAPGLLCFSKFTLMSLGAATCTAVDFDYTCWDSEEVLRRDRGSVD